MSKEKAKLYILSALQTLTIKRLIKAQKNEAIHDLENAIKELED